MSDLHDDLVDYTLADVEAAEARIRKECPTAILSRGDYDWALVVLPADKSRAFWVFRPCDMARNQPGFIGDVDKIIAALKAQAATV
jgi:hypothetical protein